MVANSTELTKSGDVFVELKSQLYNNISTVLTAPTLGGPFDVPDVVGYPVLAANVLAVAGDEASVVGLVYHGLFPVTALAGDADTPEQYAVCTKGEGVVVNMTRIPDNDGAATPVPFTKATIATALEALGFKTYFEPAEQTKQTN